MPNKLLMIDDNDEFRAMLRQFLEQRFPQLLIEEGVTGQQAIEMALHVEPQIVLMDIGLPDLNGIEAATRIKDYLPDCRIIIVTMYELESFRNVFKPDDVIDSFIGKSEVYERLGPLIAAYLGYPTG